MTADHLGFAAKVSRSRNLAIVLVFAAERRLEFSPAFQGRDPRRVQDIVASVTAEIFTQSSLTRRDLLAPTIPALKGRAKFKPSLRDEIELLSID